MAKNQTQPAPAESFYDSTLSLRRAALLLLAFTMEVGAGLALREAWRSSPDTSEDWTKLRTDLTLARQQMAEIIRQATWLRNEPEIFANRFWRDFYRSMLATATRSAMTKLLLLVVAIFLFIPVRAHAEDRLNLVIAIDLTQSVAVSGPDAKSEFQKNVEGVTGVLAQAPAGSSITVIGITDHSFAQPYILLTARVPDDPGYFGERLNSARSQLVHAWAVRSGHLNAGFQQTDILGALMLSSQVFAQNGGGRKVLVLFSDMRNCTPVLDIESGSSAPRFSEVTKKVGPLPDLNGVQVYVLGADGAGKTMAYWQSLHGFWQGYFQSTKADLEEYSVLRKLSASSR